ncbi:DUF4293 family protein [Cardinium endosymbiont of Tipula unca]|uniref:DUF4293 family protein n=1 Tax=Cardinium endosymbiont of Tipula unca TaxID=3066216 RepID=UPI0030D34371
MAIVFISMTVFIKVSVWIKLSLDGTCSLLLTPYAVIDSAGRHMLFPYNLSFLLTFFILVSSSYAITRHNNRKLQLKLIAAINFGLITLMLLLAYFIKKIDEISIPGGLSAYKVGIALPYIAFIASLLAWHYIKNDEKLVNNDRLR